MCPSTQKGYPRGNLLTEINGFEVFYHFCLKIRLLISYEKWYKIWSTGSILIIFFLISFLGSPEIFWLVKIIFHRILLNSGPTFEEISVLGVSFKNETPQHIKRCTKFFSVTTPYRNMCNLMYRSWRTCDQKIGLFWKKLIDLRWKIWI